jgi:zinc transport system ATP-binding protein
MPLVRALFANAGVSGDELVRADHLSVRAGDRLLLEDVSITLREADRISLIGPNGGGKTTLVRVLLGLLRPSAGEVRWRRGLRIGYVPQRFTVDPTLPLTVRRLMTLTTPADDRALREALARTGVEARVDAEVQSLSGGELQRVLVARALLRAPQLLVLDEPGQGIDQRGTAALYDQLDALWHERRCALLMVSHDLAHVRSAPGTVVHLDVRLREEQPLAPPPLATVPEPVRLVTGASAG